MIWGYSMVKTGFIFLLLFTLSSSVFALPDSLSVAKTSDRWLGVDKAHHFTTSAVLTGLSYYMARQEAGLTESRASQVAVGFSLSLGIGKECYDKKYKGRSSFKDIIADILGVAAGFLIIQASTE